MARNASGTHSLPAGNPVVAGTTISSTWANNTLSDISAEITNSLDRNGRGGMLAALRLFAGTSGAPGLAFSDETNTGFYRAGAGDIRFVLAGTPLLRFYNDEVYLWDGSAWNQVVSVDDILDMEFDDLVCATLEVGGSPIADVATRHSVRQNSGGSTYTRRRINFIEGLGTTISIADDGTDEEVDVTIANAALSSEYAYTAQGTNFTADGNKRYLLTADGLTVTLPAAPSDSQYVYLANETANTGTTIARNGNTIMGLSEDMEITDPYFAVGLMYYAATGDWRVVA